MADRITLITALVASAKRRAPDGRALVDFIGDIQDAIFSDNIQDGKVLVSSAEAGGTVTFAMPPGHSPLELMALCQEAIAWCYQFPNPNDPKRPDGTSALIPRRIKRFKVSFRKAIPQ
jgi:hypothetical protein